MFSNPVSGMNRDDWMKLSYQFTPNLPANVSEEAQTAQTLEGIVSKETQLKVLSIVDNAENEIGRMRTEEKDGKSDILMQHIYGDESSVSAKRDVR